MGVDGISDAQLVHRTLEGDEIAFTVLHDRYRTHVLAYAYKRMGDPDDAQTVVQDTFLKVSQNLERLKSSDKFASWMFSIASQLDAGMQRERQKQIEFISLSQVAREVEPLEVAAVIEHRKVEQRVENRNLEERVLEAIARLSDPDRLALLMRRSGMLCKEIAQALGITENAVKKRLSRARKKLKGLLHEPEAGNPRKLNHSKVPEKLGSG